MPLTLTGTGGLFTRWGALIAGRVELDTYRTGLATRESTVRAQFLSTLQSTLDGFTAQRQAQYSQATWAGNLSGLVTTVLANMCAADATYRSAQETPLQYLIRQMASTSQSINKPTVTATPSAVTGTGNGVMRASVISPTDGLALDYPHAETLQVPCTKDSYTGGATQLKETFTCTGETAGTVLGADWPGGSGQSATITALTNTDGILTDGGFENWVTNTPTNWTIATGTAGTHIFKNNLGNYVGNGSIKFVGDGSTLMKIYQTVTVTPLTQYALNFFLRRSATPGASAIRVSLTDGSGTILQDAAGNNATFSLTLSGATTSYAAYGGFLRTPRILPSTVRIQIDYTTALPAAETNEIDQMVLAAPTQAYPGGPYLAIFSGSTPFVANDRFTVPVTNSLGNSSFARSLDRELGLKALGLRIPSSGSPTIADGLIV
jgi:hypothetical protein